MRALAGDLPTEGAYRGRSRRRVQFVRDPLYVLGLAFTLRVALSAMAAWLLSLRKPFESPVIRAQYLGLHPLHDLILAPWERFDAFWYLRIAATGYSAHGGSTAFYPLYPLLIRAASFSLGGNLMLAALVVSNICFVGLLIVLYRLVEERWDDGVARRAVLLLCVFPTASFLLGAYTESLFMLLAVCCFLAVAHDSPLLAGVLAFLAALARAQGAVLAFPLLWLALRRRRSGRPSARYWLAGVAPALAACVFPLYVRLVAHGGFVATTFRDQWNMSINPPWVTLYGYWSALAGHHWQIFSYPSGNWVDLLNILLALGTLALVIPSRRMLDTPLWLYGLATWVISLSLHQSTARYLLTVFPAIIVLAARAPGRWTSRLAVLVGAPLMVFVGAEFVMWSFVG